MKKRETKKKRVVEERMMERQRDGKRDCWGKTDDGEREMMAREGG